MFVLNAPQSPRSDVTTSSSIRFPADLRSSGWACRFARLARLPSTTAIFFA